MTSAAQAAGTGPKVIWALQEWTLSPITDAIRGELEMWAKQRAIANAAKMPKADGSVMNDAEKRVEVEKAKTEIRSGFYDYGAEGCRRMLASLRGFELQLLLQFRVVHPGMTLEQLQRLRAEAGEDLNTALEALLPNRPAPTPTTAPGTEATAAPAG